jgi:hypothetical protein
MLVDHADGLLFVHCTEHVFSLGHNLFDMLGCTWTLSYNTVTLPFTLHEFLINCTHKIEEITEAVWENLYLKI